MFHLVVWSIILLAIAISFRVEILKALFLWGDRRNPTNQPGRAWTTFVIKDEDGIAYMSRFYLPRLFGFRPMLHWIHQADRDRHLHDHPWTWALSILLTGWYVEQRLDNAPRNYFAVPWRRVAPAREVWFFNLLRSHDYHRITHLEGEVFTLFIAGPRTPDNRWGFLTEEGWVESSEYLKERAA